jgi:hypothetical protein
VKPADADLENNVELSLINPTVINVNRKDGKLNNEEQLLDQEAKSLTSNDDIEEKSLKRLEYEKI